MDAEWFGLKLVVRSLFAITVIAMMISMVHAQPPTLLWSDPTVETVDIKLSRDGNYVVVASFQIGDGFGGQVRFYRRSSGTPLWTWSSGTFFSVAISEHGDYVAASGLVDGTPVVVYWKNARAPTVTPRPPDWTSNNLFGVIERRNLALSDDGNFMVACGTGSNVYYWAGMNGRSDSEKSTTWSWGAHGFVLSVDISGDGNYVAAGTSTPSVAYWKNAASLSPVNANPNWESTSPDHSVIDVAISDDGDYVAAATGPLADQSVHYWAGAKSLTGDPPHTWYYGADVPFTSVDMSCDGDSVIAGSGGRFVEGGSHSVYFWGGARSLTGGPSPTWVYHTDYPVWDVAINDAGTYMAAVDFPIDTVYFFNRQGNLLWQDQAISGDKLSISCDGGTLAVGTPTVTTAYLFDTGYSTPCCGQAPPVGGVVLTSSNALGIITPYLALAVVAGAAALIVAFAKKRKA
jgi:hypothetical protein